MLKEVALGITGLTPEGQKALSVRKRLREPVGPWRWVGDGSH